jgi:hypothetical protein
MSTGLPVLFQTMFDNMVKAAYQTGGGLRNAVRFKDVKGASTARFYRVNRGIASPRLPQTRVQPMNTTYVPIDVTLTDWNAPEYTDVFDQAATTIDEQRVVANNIAMAIGRRTDQMIIDAVVSVGAASIVHGSVGLTDAKIRQIVRFFDDRGVPTGKRHAAISAWGKQDIAGETRFSSNDFVERGVVSTGRIPDLYGIKWHVIETRAEGGLPKSGTTRTNFAWDEDAVGLAVALDGPVRVDWVAEMTSWLANQYLKAGAAVIDPDGILEFETTES